jgi:hypothetical protein
MRWRSKGGAVLLRPLFVSLFPVCMHLKRTSNPRAGQTEVRLKGKHASFSDLKRSQQPQALWFTGVCNLAP